MNEEKKVEILLASKADFGTRLHNIKEEENKLRTNTAVFLALLVAGIFTILSSEERRDRLPEVALIIGAVLISLATTALAVKRFLGTRFSYYNFMQSLAEIDSLLGKAYGATLPGATKPIIVTDKKTWNDLTKPFQSHLERILVVFIGNFVVGSFAIFGGQAYGLSFSWVIVLFVIWIISHILGFWYVLHLDWRHFKERVVAKPVETNA